jgi:hypothetical protein
MEKYYDGVIFYNNGESAKVKVKNYKFMTNALLLIFDTVIDCIPYCSFTKASLEKLEKENNQNACNK